MAQPSPHLSLVVGDDAGKEARFMNCKGRKVKSLLLHLKQYSLTITEEHEDFEDLCSAICSICHVPGC